MAEEPDAYKHSLQSYLRDGYRFPLARQKAFQDFTKEEGIASILEQPNNILGIEYLKALSRLNSSIQPFAISTNWFRVTMMRQTFTKYKQLWLL
ncbi:MAG: nucleotidyltransferase family protein [Coprococcus sp.]